MDEEIPPNRPYRIRRPSSSLISSTTSSFPAPQHPPPNSPYAPSRPSSSRLNNPSRDIDEDIQPSSSTPSFGGNARRTINSNHFNASSSMARSSSPLGSPDSTYWGPAPSPLQHNNNSSFSGGPPTPGGNCVVSSSTIDDVPPSPFSPEQQNNNLMLPPLAVGNSGVGSAASALPSSNAVSVISGNRSTTSSNTHSNDCSSNNNDLPAASWDPAPLGGGFGRGAAESSSASSSGSMAGSSSSFGGNSFSSSFNPATTTSSSSSLGIPQNNSNPTYNPFNPVRSKIKKASSFERFSAQAQASSNINNNNNNMSGNNSANSTAAESLSSSSSSASTIASNSTSINVTTTASSNSSRLLWDFIPTTTAATTTSSSGLGSYTSRLNPGLSSILSSSLSESFSSAKQPFHLKKLAAKIASVFEQEQLLESGGQPVQQQSSSTSSSSLRHPIEEPLMRSSEDNCLGLIPQGRESTSSHSSPLNLTEASSVQITSPPKARNSIPTKSFLTPKQKLLQRLQSGELFNTLSNSPPPAPLPPTTLPLQQSPIQQQHQILLSSLQQPPSQQMIPNDPVHQLHQQEQEHEVIMTHSQSASSSLSPNSSPTPRASAELERYVNSMSISSYEAFIRASGEDFVVQDTLGKNMEGDLNNIQVLYDAGDPYTYAYYGNILVDEMDFTNSGASGIPPSGSSGGRPLLVMPSGGELDDPGFQNQQQLQQQGHGHLEFILGMNPDEQRQQELREEDLQLGDIGAHHQSFLDGSDNVSGGKSQAESTLRNLLMMEPLRAHDDSWISAATAAEYQSRHGIPLNGMGLRGMNSSSGSSTVNASLLNNSWINDWATRANATSWQQAHHELADDHGEQNEVMDMSVLDMTEKGLGKRHSQNHSGGGQVGMNIDEVDLAEGSGTGGLSLLTPMDLQQPLGLALTTGGKNSEVSEPIDLQHPHHRMLLQESDEPVNLMSVVNLEHEFSQAQAHAHHQQELLHAQVQSSNSVYSNSTNFSSSAPPKVLSPPTTFTHNFEAISQAESLEERKIILMKKVGGAKDAQPPHQLQTNCLSPADLLSPSDPTAAPTNVILDKPVQPRSIASLPNLLSLSRLVEEGWTIVTNRSKVIPSNTRFGPVEGPLRKVYQEDLDTSDAVYPCLIMVDNNTFWQLDRNDDELCNWMKFVRLAHSASAQNCLISEINGLLYFTTCKDVHPKVELQASYDFDYAQRYGLPYLDPNSPEVVELAQPELVEKLVEEDIESYICVECDLGFTNQEDFNEHVEGFHNEPEIQPKKKAAVSKYLNSKSSKKSEKIIGTATTPKLRNKTKKDSSEFTLPGTILCKHCGGVYLSMTELNTHLKDSAPCAKSGSIELLVLKSRQTSSSRERKENNKPVEEPPINSPPPSKLKCSVCYKGFANLDRLDKHKLVHNGEESKPLQCTVCLKRFLTNSALAGHVKTHAEEGKCFECPMCNFATQQLLPLKEHVRTHKNKENGMFHCPHCTKKFSMYSMVRKHIRAFHGPRQFTCDLCPMTFPSSDKLKLHKLKHSDHREFLCAECGRQFKRKDKLREHTKRMHEIKKKPSPLVPDILQNVPARKEKFFKKFNSKVTEEEMSKYVFKCTDCLLGFKRRGMLVNHLAKRHPEKPPSNIPELSLPILRPARNYFCPYCERKYKSSSKRKSHILKSHPGKQLPPQLRGKDKEHNMVPADAVPATTIADKADNLPVTTTTTPCTTTSEPQLDVVSTTTTAVDDNGVSGNVVTRRDPIVGTPRGCQWCHRQYATRAKLLQHQRKSHLYLMPPEMQTPRTQKNNVVKTSKGIITVSVTDVAPIHSQSLGLLNSSSDLFSTINPDALGDHSTKSGSGGNGENNVIGYLLTTTTVTNGTIENALDPELVMVSQSQMPQILNEKTPASANLQHQNIVNANANDVISSTSLNLNLNQT